MEPNQLRTRIMHCVDYKNRTEYMQCWLCAKHRFFSAGLIGIIQQFYDKKISQRLVDSGEGND